GRKIRRAGREGPGRGQEHGRPHEEDQGAQHVDDEPYVHGIAASLGSPRCALRAVPSTSSEERLDPWFDLRLEEEEDLVPWLDDGGAPGDEDLVLPDDEA